MHPPSVQPDLETRLAAAHAEWQQAVRRLRQAETAHSRDLHDAKARQATTDADARVRAAGVRLARIAEQLHQERRRATRTGRP